jgi:hypothetical protein
LDLSGLGHGPAVGFFSKSTEPSDYLKGEEFIEQLIVLTVSQDELSSTKLVMKEKILRIQCTVCYINRYIQTTEQPK